MIQLHLRARHFKGTNYDSISDCVVVKSVIDQLNAKSASEGVDHVDVEYGNRSEKYLHDMYRHSLFRVDCAAASLADYDDTIIRTIELHPVC